MKTIATVGLCVRNSEATVGETVQSVISQDFPHDSMEIVVVDGRSSDKTMSIIINSLSTSDIQVKTYSDQGKGLGQARQIVVDNARGDYIIWVDGDMVLPENYLRKQVEFMDRNPKVGAARGKLGIIEEGSVALLENLSELGERYGFKEKTPKARVIKVIAVYDTCRVKAIKQTGGFDKEIKGASEDREMVYRMWKDGWLLATTEVKFYHRFRKTWRDLWKEYSWWGYGEHYVSHKHPGLVLLWQTIPIARALGGLRRVSDAYKMTNLKISFLLPIQNFFKASAFWFGFLKSHRERYGHKKK
jgi:glycosyltransferase involved in cell wall biosynthesis